MGTEGHEWLEVIEKRYENSVSAVWFLAYLLHPSYSGDALTQKDIRDAKSYVAELPGNCPILLRTCPAKKISPHSRKSEIVKQAIM